MTLNIENIRSQFPSLSGGYIFADNAGGSQVCAKSPFIAMTLLKSALQCTGTVISAITDYLTNSNVQLGQYKHYGLLVF